MQEHRAFEKLHGLNGWGHLETSGQSDVSSPGEKVQDHELHQGLLSAF